VGLYILVGSSVSPTDGDRSLRSSRLPEWTQPGVDGTTDDRQCKSCGQCYWATESCTAEWFDVLQLELHAYTIQGTSCVALCLGETRHEQWSLLLTNVLYQVYNHSPDVNKSRHESDSTCLLHSVCWHRLGSAGLVGIAVTRLCVVYVLKLVLIFCAPGCNRKKVQTK
jgi:hypothetical protein